MASKLILHTDRIPEEYQTQVDQLLNKIVPADVEVEQYNHNMEISWRDINKYAHCTNQADMLAVNPDYKNDQTSDKTWVYPLTELKTAKQVFQSANIVSFEGELPNLTSAVYMFAYNPMTSWNVELPKLVNSQDMFNGTQLTSWNVELPNLKSAVGMFLNCPLTSFNVELPNLDTGIHMFQRNKLTSWNVELPNLVNARNMFYKVTTLTSFNVELPKLYDADVMFTDCILNKESALRILNSIPAYTSGSHPLTIGIHVDHQNDEEVLAAIANAEAKGWTMTVQWNGTPTAQGATTYGLRKPPIYARVSEMENGERCLNWGHYVTDPIRYEEFCSVEEAREHFGLPIEDENLKPD